MNRGGIVTVKGDFTMLRFIASLDAQDLERTVGYEKGRLKGGFLIVALAEDENITPDDFVLKASTRWSGGKLPESNSNGDARSIEHVLSQRDQDPVALKIKVSQFFARRGGNTPAKVLPNLRHAEGMTYPDAEALGPGLRSGVPQFALIRLCRFVIVRDVT